jgi:hypothetical protein
MDPRQRVQTISQGTLADLLGPAEGQYNTVSFNEELESANPSSQQIPCYDIYYFSLDEPTAEVCFDLTLDAPIAADPAFAGLNVWSNTLCDWILASDIKIPAGNTTGQQCRADLPAGDYLIFVYGRDITPAIQYTLTIDPSSPLKSWEFQSDETCGAVPGCG